MTTKARFALTLSLCAILTAGCRTVPAGFGEDTAGPTAQRIADLLPDSLFPPSNAGILVVSLTRGDTLFSRNPDLLFTPASGQKLLTSAAALHTLHAGYLFTTTISIDTMAGSRLVVRGTGDPLLATPDLDSLVTQLLPRLPASRRWTLAADLSALDSVEWGKGWMWDDEPDPTAMVVSPLSVNGNTATVIAAPARGSGGPAVLRLEPETGVVALVNNTVTVADSERAPLRVERSWKDGRNLITVSGEITSASAPVTRTLSLRAPSGVALGMIAERLRAKGVTVDSVSTAGASAACCEAALVSHGIDSVLVTMNKTSDNLAAEVLLKTVGGVRFEEPGSWTTGIRAARATLAELGVDTSSLVMADGSGTSRYNLVSARHITQLLAGMARDSVRFPLFRASLPVAGRDGTLASRMRGSAAEGRLRGKTGTMTGASSLSGYIETAGGELLAFSMLMGYYPTPAGPYRRVQDRIGSLLAGLTREPLSGGP